MKRAVIATAAAVFLGFPAAAAQQASPRQPQTMASVQSHVEAQFARTDADKDGYVTPAEAAVAHTASQAQKAQRASTREQRQAKRAARLARFDANKDGSISQAERQAQRPAAAPNSPARAERQAVRAQKRAERQALNGGRALRINDKRFARLDTNKDGRLALAEVTVRVAKRFQRVDANRDGSITRDERRSARALRQSRRQG
jgi:Ca2+-binding EF-hand superfamily protein